MKLLPSLHNFVCKSAVPSQSAQQENYKLIIQSVNIIIRTKKLTSTAHGALVDFLILQNMRHHLSRIQMKHLSISANWMSINFDNVFTNALSDLIIVGLVSVADFASGYQRNLFNFKNFGVKCIEMKRNGTSRPSEGYTPNFANEQYITDYMTFVKDFECYTSDKCVSLTPSAWKNRYTLFAFKITDGPIRPGMFGPRSNSVTGSARLDMSFATAIND